MTPFSMILPRVALTEVRIVPVTNGTSPFVGG
jgi:hypothetical protein